MKEILLRVNGVWVIYTGSTSIRKLYCRAHEAANRGSKSFFVHEYPCRSVSGAIFPSNPERYLTNIAFMCGVPVHELPTEFHLYEKQVKDPLKEAWKEIERLEENTMSKDYEWDVYVAGSLRNPAIPSIAEELSERKTSVFCDWFAAGPEADDHWKAFYQELGFGYRDALLQPASVNTYNFDKKHMDNSRAMVLVLPAGKSGHLELGYFLGCGKPGYILLDGNDCRWDVMYQFATGVTDSIEELKEWLAQ